MSESKFNDGRILRSDDTTLTLQEVRILYGMLEQGENDIKDLQKLQSIGSKLESVLGNYYLLCDEATMAARRNLRAGAPEQLVNTALGVQLEELDETYGKEDALDILLTMAEWQWAMDRIKDRKDYIGGREVRGKILRIYDAITEAKGMQFVGDHKQLVWIKGEINPASEGLVPLNIR